MSAYKPELTDLSLSPITGLTRKHWLDSAKHMLRGVFQHVESFDSPITMPKQHEITYPQADDPQHRFQAFEFEGLARTLMLAAPVIKNDESTELEGIKLRDYYANQILLATNPSSERYLGLISEFSKEHGKMQYQHTVEGAALCIGLMLCKEQIWDRYDSKQQAQVADLLSDYAHARTIGHNWRFFNVLMLTFLKINGFNIDEAALKDHMHNLLSNYVGDGWYVDDITYDFYNPWGFHFYGPIWCHWYGYEHEPKMAQIIEERNHRFMQDYPRFFGRDGQQLMWGRSIIYRCAASAAFGAHFLLKNTVADAGFVRKIASQNLMQFLGKDELYHNGVPCLGYYGPFEPLVQFYSCAASPFWIGKTYLALALDENSPFWIAEENENFWEQIGEQSESVNIEGPGIQVTNHGSTGTAEIRTAKVPKHDPYYNQLQFNTAFCIEDENGEGHNPSNYSIREFDSRDDYRIPLDIAFNKFEDDIFYRQMNTQPTGLGDPNKGGVNRGPERLDLADIIIPGGVIRVDRARIPYANDLQLGHFSLPLTEGVEPTVTKRRADNSDVIEASIPGRKVAVTAVHGWSEVDVAYNSGKNAEATKSAVVYASRTREKDYSGVENFITVMLHRTDDGDWSEDELQPIAHFEILEWTEKNHPFGVKITLKNGKTYTIDYGKPDGRRII